MPMRLWIQRMVWWSWVIWGPVVGTLGSAASQMLVVVRYSIARGLRCVWVVVGALLFLSSLLWSSGSSLWTRGICRLLWRLRGGAICELFRLWRCPYVLFLHLLIPLRIRWMVVWTCIFLVWGRGCVLKVSQGLGTYRICDGGCVVVRFHSLLFWCVLPCRPCKWLTIVLLSLPRRLNSSLFGMLRGNWWVRRTWR